LIEKIKIKEKIKIYPPIERVVRKERIKRPPPNHVWR
jgi:hypothetical protein